MTKIQKINKVCGNDLTKYHKIHKSSSYHCIKCGSQVFYPEFYPCDECNYTDY